MDPFSPPTGRTAFIAARRFASIHGNALFSAGLKFTEEEDIGPLRAANHREGKRLAIAAMHNDNAVLLIWWISCLNPSSNMENPFLKRKSPKNFVDRINRIAPVEWKRCNRASRMKR
jgi:hypothetical protein